MTYTGTISRLVARFCVIGLPVYLAICATMIAAYQDHRRQGLEAEIGAEIAAASASLAATLPPFLERGETTGAVSILSLASGTRAVRCIQVVTVDEPDDPFALWPGHLCERPSRNHVLTVPIRSNNVILGHLTTHFDTAWAAKKLEHEAGFVYAATAIGTLGALIAFGVAFHFSIGLRVSKLHAAIRHKRDTGQDRAVRDSTPDDLGEVARTYDAMLEAARAQRDAIEKERRRRAEIEERAAAAKAEHDVRTRFLEAASHELRTPLNGILGAVDVINGPNLTARQKRSAMLLRGAVGGLEATVASILKAASGPSDI